MSPHSHTAAVQRIYEQHHSWLHGWLKAKLYNACDAADVAHDTFVRILGAANAAQIREPRDYLATVARGLVIDRYRRRAIELAYQQTVAERPQATVISEEDKALIIETLVAVDKALDDLGPRTKRIFMLSQIDGLTYQQIALDLKVSLTTVKKHMIRAFTECSLLLVQMS
jgi:RNA polymerase sigma-70 factor (ECF subfamily)